MGKSRRSHAAERLPGSSAFRDVSGKTNPTQCKGARSAGSSAPCEWMRSNYGQHAVGAKSFTQRAMVPIQTQGCLQSPCTPRWGHISYTCAHKLRLLSYRSCAHPIKGIELSGEVVRGIVERGVGYVSLRVVRVGDGTIRSKQALGLTVGFRLSLNAQKELVWWSMRENLVGCGATKEHMDMICMVKVTGNVWTAITIYIAGNRFKVMSLGSSIEGGIM